MKPKIVCSLNRKWNLKSKSNEIITEVEVPGTVFEALVDNELIDDPFYGENEHIAKDIFNCDWEFETQFDPSHTNTTNATSFFFLLPIFNLLLFFVYYC